MKLSRLGLDVGQAIAYVFDFGDEWRVRLKLVELRARAAPLQAVFDQRGEAPPQYDFSDGDFEDVASAAARETGVLAPFSDSRLLRFWMGRGEVSQILKVLRPAGRTFHLPEVFESSKPGSRSRMPSQCEHRRRALGYARSASMPGTHCMMSSTPSGVSSRKFPPSDRSSA